MDGKRANLAAFEVGETVGRIEQKAAGIRVERDGDRVHGEIAAPEVLHNRGEAGFRLVSGMRVYVFARSCDARVDIPREDEFDVPQIFIFTQNLRTSLLELPGNARGIPLHSEIKITNGHAGSQVPYGTA